MFPPRHFENSSRTRYPDPSEVLIMKKLRVGILFGGRSGEHEVSLLSAASVLKAIDRKKYEVVPIGITKQGQWVTADAAESLLSNGASKSEPRPLRAGDPDA